MTAKKKAMGRGLDAIFEANSEEGNNGVSVLRISDIEVNKGQPRKEFEEGSLAELSESIKLHGVIQPIIVREAGDGFYIIVAGERRYRAAKLAGLTEIPALVLELTAGEAAEISLIENIQRRDLNPIEEAAAYKALMDEYNMTQEELATKISKPRSSVANMLRLLELPESIAILVSKGTLTAGHAKALMSLKDKGLVDYASGIVIRLNLNVRATESLVKKLNTEKKEPEVSKEKEIYESALKERMFAVLGRKVKINRGTKKTLELSYTDNDDLETLIKVLCGNDIFD